MGQNELVLKFVHPELNFPRYAFHFLQLKHVLLLAEGSHFNYNAAVLFIHREFIDRNLCKHQHTRVLSNMCSACSDDDCASHMKRCSSRVRNMFV